jgi:flagellar hook-associated protein 1 FlgK
MADRLDASGRDVDAQVRGAVEDINHLTSQIAHLNETLGRTVPTDSTFPHLQDQQAQLVRQLSEIVDVDVTPREDGGVDVTIGNGRALVIGRYDYALTMTQSNGVTGVFAGTNDVSTEISAGTLGGLLYARDVLLPVYHADLDALANEFVQQVNTVHAAGVGGDGGTGRNFFAFSSAITPPAGAAGALVVDPAVAADDQLIAAAGAGAPVGDNATARTIAGLRNARVVGGTATLVDSWGQLVYRVGRDSQSAASEQQSRSDIVSQVDALRDQVSGISLDEEAMHLLKYQRAYEANARFFTTVDATLDMLMSLAR